MQLISVTPARRSGVLILHFSDNSVLQLDSTDFVKLNLKKNAHLSYSLLVSVRRCSVRFLLTSYALRQVAISPKIEVVLRPKLKSQLRQIISKYRLPPMFVSPALIDEVIGYLHLRRLLNVPDFVDSQIRRHPHLSRRALIARLHQFGVDREQLQSLPSPQDENTKIKYFLCKKHLTRQDLTDNKTRNKIIASLLRKGFSLNQVKSVIDAVVKKQ